MIKKLMSLAILALALGGCGESDPTAAELWCSGLCKAVQRCGGYTSDCVADCVVGRPGLFQQSVSGAAAQEPCLAKLSCLAVGGNESVWKDELDACWSQAKNSVEITPHVRHVCAADAMVRFDCGYTARVVDCDRDFAMWSDDVLDRLAPCQALSSCDAFIACEKAAFSSS